MRVFTKLDHLTLRSTSWLYSRSSTPLMTQEPILGLSTDILIMFFKYLQRIPSLNIGDICVENLGDAVTAICGEVNGMHIEYKIVGFGQGSSALSCLELQDIIKEKAKHGDGPDKINNARVGYEVPSEITAPPHMQLIERFRHNLKTMYICMGGQDHINIMMNSNTTNTAHGYYVEHIFQNCPNLKEVVLSGTHLLNYNPDEPVHSGPKIKRLKLGFSQINPAFLTYLSGRLLSLRYLDLQMCMFVDAYGDTVSNPTNISIDMPYTNFSEITWEHTDYVFDTPLPKFYLKTVDNHYGTRYFSGKIGHFGECPETNYENSLIEEFSLSVYIRCKQVDWIRFNTCDVNMLIDLEDGVVDFLESPIEHVRDDYMSE